MTWTALALYLTLTGPGDTSMTVVWHTEAQALGSVVSYAEQPRGAWRQVRGSSHLMPHTSRRVHVVRLTGLRPDTEYEFRIPHRSSAERFRTLPTHPTRPVKIAAGGDTMHRKPLFAKTLERIAEADADLVAFGGDLAYANGQPQQAARWFDWCDAVTDLLVTSEGRRIPVVCAIGNHEVNGGYGQRPEKAPFFHALFPSPGTRGYDVLDLGEDISLFLLNTNHTTPVGGDQAKWLDAELARRSDREHLLAIYHVPGYPSHRSYGGTASAAVRRQWAPLFDEHGLDVAYENHDHTYKRSPRIKGGRVDPAGVLYVGDGAVGTSTRKVRSPVDSWWLEHTKSINHFILTTIHGDQRVHEGVDHKGQRFDRWSASEAHLGTESLHVLLQDKMDELLAKHQTPGFQVALVSDGRPVLTRGFGVAEAGKQRPVTPASVFQVGSISKPVAAAAVMHLVQAGRLDLDAPASRYLPPEWTLRPRAGSDHDADQVTLRRLLSHTAGLNVHGYPGLHPKLEVPSTLRSLNGVVSSNPAVRLTLPPGQEWRYSGGGYTVAQLIVEHLTGETFAKVAHRDVLGPMGMTSSSYDPDEDITKMCVVGHGADGKPKPRYRFAAKAAASLHATALDVARFLCVVMDDGAPPNPKGPAWLGRKTTPERRRAMVRQLLTDQTPDEQGYGIGFSLRQSAAGELQGLTFGHGGSNRGFKAVALAHREKRVAVVILANGDDAQGPINRLAEELLLELAQR